MTKLLIATTNQHKLREYAAIFAPLALELCTLADVGIDEDVEESGTTFAENAQLKAEFYAKRSGLLSMADDSGLEVIALDGEPGIHSRRYAGPDATDAERNQLLLQKMEQIPFHARLARFVCVIALTHPDGTTELVEGILPGVIETAPRGTHGFGYDPLFYVLDEDKTLAELPPERKNAISHRARAAAAAYEVLQHWLTNDRL
ncbi:MAG: XTP/dITP diphosphatase [Chloroflexi bacterium AL-W]|nr:XTP/dITP diphosphatase [Chloroflexi bacterium AL-N1]NOK70516.1 XTP/dITP diphosphatase [Chloroflexi bacterium AL-N10]NOK78125.1 XTP/dITP diphosphatase [Chloroflexi bacterium AL-N5]NOK85224.1 XTP/dITP diphosphatase [Chloroflexi bacterium AL-W]NOK91989.1 XTP/dITP diphosphatase [Chloroflexi bacterium AL-N15]